MRSETVQIACGVRTRAGAQRTKSGRARVRDHAAETPEPRSRYGVADQRVTDMNDAGFDRQHTVTAALVGLLIGTIVVSLLGLSFTGHMETASHDETGIVAR